MYSIMSSYEHDYENGHTCPSCGKTGIHCTIEDGFCENDGDCDDCIKERYYRQMEREEGGDAEAEWIADNECWECGGWINDSCICEEDETYV